MSKVYSVGPLLNQLYPLGSISPRLRIVCLEILEYLAFHSPSTKYRVEIDTKKAHGTIHKCFKLLLEKGFITEKEKSTWRTGLPSSKYVLSTRGLLYILEHGLENVKINEVSSGMTFIERHEAQFPLVFGKWRTFTENNLETLAESQFFQTRGSKELEQFYERFFLSNLPANASHQNNWWNVLRSDPEIKGFCDNVLKTKLEMYEEKTVKLQTAIQNTHALLNTLNRSQ